MSFKEGNANNASGLKMEAGVSYGSTIRRATPSEIYHRRADELRKEAHVLESLAYALNGIPVTDEMLDILTRGLHR